MVRAFGAVRVIGAVETVGVLGAVGVVRVVGSVGAVRVARVEDSVLSRVWATGGMPHEMGDQ